MWLRVRVTVVGGRPLSEAWFLPPRLWCLEVGHLGDVEKVPLKPPVLPWDPVGLHGKWGSDRAALELGAWMESQGTAYTRCVWGDAFDLFKG